MTTASSLNPWAKSVFPALSGGDAAILFCFVFLYLVFAGPGPWSLDTQLWPGEI